MIQILVWSISLLWIVTNVIVTFMHEVCRGYHTFEWGGVGCAQLEKNSVNITLSHFSINLHRMMKK